MPRFVIGGGTLFLIGEHHAFPFHPHEDLVLGKLKVFELHHRFVQPCRKQCRLIHEIFEVRPGKSWCPA